MGNSSTSSSNNTTTKEGNPSSGGEASGEFQKISMPPPGKTSPTVETETLAFANSLASSGVLVSPLDSSTMLSSSSSAAAPSSSAAPAGGTATATRRIIKAAQPPVRGFQSLTVASEMDPSGPGSHAEDDEETRTQSKKQHLPPVMSPKASSELLDESLEKSKTKQLKATRQHQKSSRDKAVGERRMKTTAKAASGSSGTSSGSAASKPQANPFSKFLSAFSVDAARPDHKRPYEVGSSDVDQDDGIGNDGSTGSGAMTPNNMDGSESSNNALTEAKLRDVFNNESKKRIKLDDENDSSSQSKEENDNDEKKQKSSSSSSSSFAIPKSIGGIDLSKLSDFVETLPPWVGMVGAAAGVAGVAIIVTTIFKKKKE